MLLESLKIPLKIIFTKPVILKSDLLYDINLQLAKSTSHPLNPPYQRSLSMSPIQVWLRLKFETLIEIELFTWDTTHVDSIHAYTEKELSNPLSYPKLRADS